MGVFNNFKNFIGLSDEDDEDILKDGSSRDFKVINNPAQVILAKITVFDDVTEIAKHFRGKNSIVLNFESADKEVTRRVLDFLSGVAYALDGCVNQVAKCTYLMTPDNVEFSNNTYDFDSMT